MKKITFLMINFIAITTFGQVKLTHATNESFNGTEWVESEKSSFTYDGSNLTEIMDYYQDGSGTWVLYGKETYTYDANNNVTSETYESFGNDLYGYKTIYTYTNGKVTQQLEQDLEGEIWVNSSKIDINYENGVVVSGDATEWDGTSWIKGGDSAMYTFEYNNGFVSYLIIEEGWNGTSWDSKSRNAFTYDSNNFRNSAGFEIWDGSSWNPGDYKEEFENDATGNRIVSKEYAYEDGSWVLESEDSYQYDSTQLLSSFTHPFVLSEIDLLLDGNPHVNKVLSKVESNNNNRKIFHYSDDVTEEEDGELKLTHATEEYYNGSDWIESGTTSYIYGGNNIIEIISPWDRTIYTYTASNKIATEIDQDNGENSSKIAYTYNSNGEITQELYEDWENSTWNKSSKIDFVYTNNRVTSANVTEWDGSNWVLGEDSGVYLLEYNNDGNVSYIVHEFDWSGSAWDSKSRSVLVYNANNKILSEEEEEWNGSNWVSGEYKEEFVYDVNGNQINRKETYVEDGKEVIDEEIFTFVNNVLMSDYKHPFVLADIDILLGRTQFVNKLLSKADADNTYRTVYHYNDDIASVDKIAKVNLTVYPNPTKDFIFIEEDNFTVENVEVFNILGKKVKATIKSHFSIKEFPSGVYVLKINTTGGKTITTKVVKK